jgi:hypothetical protein
VKILEHVHVIRLNGLSELLEEIDPSYPFVSGGESDSISKMTL